jgi:hypothetical protein
MSCSEFSPELVEQIDGACRWFYLTLCLSHEWAFSLIKPLKFLN